MRRFNRLRQLWATGARHACPAGGTLGDARRHAAVGRAGSVRNGFAVDGFRRVECSRAPLSDVDLAHDPDESAAAPVRTAIGAAGIALGVATMLCVVGRSGGDPDVRAHPQFDTEIIVFETNVSDLFFSATCRWRRRGFRGARPWRRREPALFGIVPAPDNPVITCFGVRRTRRGSPGREWLAGRQPRISGTTATAWCSGSGRRSS